MALRDITRVGLIQQAATGDRQSNLERGVRAVYAAVAEGASLVAFAELAFSPFYPRRRAETPPLELAEPIPGPTVERFQRLAAELGVVMVPNLYERDGDRAFDASPVIDADGSLLGVTRMVHVTDYQHFHEQDYYAPGDNPRLVYDTAVGRVGVAICYDRHFPELMRALGLQGAELVVVPQAGTVGEWPAGLFEAELQAAAFQNGYFTALVNRVGREGELDFAGESFVCSPAGEVIAQAGHGTEETLLVDIDLAEVEQSHARRVLLRDRRPKVYRKWFD